MAESKPLKDLNICQSNPPTANPLKPNIDVKPKQKISLQEYRERSKPKSPCKPDTVLVPDSDSDSNETILDDQTGKMLEIGAHSSSSESRYQSDEVEKVTEKTNKLKLTKSSSLSKCRDGELSKKSALSKSGKSESALTSSQNVGGVELIKIPSVNAGDRNIKIVKVFPKQYVDSTKAVEKQMLKVKPPTIVEGKSEKILSGSPEIIDLTSDEESPVASNVKNLPRTESAEAVKPNPDPVKSFEALSQQAKVGSHGTQQANGGLSGPQVIVVQKGDQWTTVRSAPDDDLRRRRDEIKMKLEKQKVVSLHTRVLRYR